MHAKHPCTLSRTPHACIVMNMHASKRTPYACKAPHASRRTPLACKAPMGFVKDPLCTQSTHALHDCEFWRRLHPIYNSIDSTCMHCMVKQSTMLLWWVLYCQLKPLNWCRTECPKIIIRMHLLDLLYHSSIHIIHRHHSSNIIIAADYENCRTPCPGGHWILRHCYAMLQ